MMETPAHYTIGKYEVIEKLGKGAMGTVYKAFDPIIKREVAIKTINKKVIRDQGGDLNEVLARFEREAQMAGRLNHPNIVSVFDYLETDDATFIVMEIVQGVELKTLFDNDGRPTPFDDSIEIMEQLLDALFHSHQNGVVHRDIKPANIIIMPDNRIKITDFGIATFESSDLTQHDTLMGTPSYMSPEQARGEKVDFRSDLFSAGVIFYQLVTGKRPFSAPKLFAIMNKIQHEDPVPPSRLNPQLPPAIDHVIQTALAKDPAHRHTSANHFKGDIDAIFSNRPSDDETIIASSHHDSSGDRTIIGHPNDPLSFVPEMDDGETVIFTHLPPLEDNQGENQTDHTVLMDRSARHEAQTAHTAQAQHHMNVSTPDTGPIGNRHSSNEFEPVLNGEISSSQTRPKKSKYLISGIVISVLILICGIFSYNHYVEKKRMKKARLEQLEKEKKIEQERIAKQEQLEKEKKIEQERIAKQEQLEKEKKIEQERIAKQEQLEKEKKIEQERIAKQEQLEKEKKIEQERIAKQEQLRKERRLAEIEAELARLNKERRAIESDTEEITSGKNYTNILIKIAEIEAKQTKLIEEKNRLLEGGRVTPDKATNSHPLSEYSFDNMNEESPIDGQNNKLHETRYLSDDTLRPAEHADTQPLELEDNTTMDETDNANEFIENLFKKNSASKYVNTRAIEPRTTSTEITLTDPVDPEYVQTDSDFIEAVENKNLKPIDSTPSKKVSEQTEKNDVIASNKTGSSTASAKAFIDSLLKKNSATRSVKSVKPDITDTVLEKNVSATLEKKDNIDSPRERKTETTDPMKFLESLQ